jgi:hypothetical protein
LPRGLHHRATSNGPTSIHLSFGIRRPTGLDFVDLMMQRLMADTKTREYLPRLSTEDGDEAVRAYLWIMFYSALECSPSIRRCAASFCNNTEPSSTA